MSVWGKMHKRLAWVMVVTLLAVLAVTGCGGSKKEQETQTKESSIAEEVNEKETKPDPNEEPAIRNIFAMDTVMTVTVWGKQAEEACQAAEDEINRIDAMVSTGSADSEITNLNHKGKGKVSEETAYMIEKSLELYEDTQGLFDISIYPVMRAWGFTDQKFQVPEEKELKKLLSSVDAGMVSYDADSQEVRFDDPDVEIDLGGIAKGYTSDQVIQVISGYDVDCALINLGGNVKTLNRKITGEEWRIAVQDPENPNEICGVVTCCDKAVITSGGYQRFFEEDGITYHHIIDPRSGYPAHSGLTSVSIVTADGTLADGLSTSLFIMGLEEAHKYWKAHKDEFDAVLVDEAGKVYVTGGLKDRFWSERDWEVLE